MESDNPENKEPVKLQWSSAARRYRLMQACCMPLIYICLGVVTTIVSPTLIDMKHLFKCDYEEYSQALMMKSIGIFLGSYIGGIANDRFRRYINLFFFGNVFLFGVTSISMPWYPSLILLGGLYTIQGLCQGCLNVACSSYSLAVWAEKAPLPVHALHTAFTFGQILGPVISQPFITPVNSTDANSSVTLAPTVTPEPSKLVFAPYVICGIFSCAVSLIFAIFACIPPPKEIIDKNQKPKTLYEMFSPAACADGKLLFATFWVICLFVAYVVHVSPMNSITIFLYPVAVKSRLHFPTTIAIILQSVYYTSGTVGRIIFGLLSHYVPIKILVFIEIITQLGGFAGLAFLGLSAQYMFWIWICSVTFFASPIYPAVMAWADRYIEVTGLVVAVIDTGIGVGVFASSWLSGLIFQQKGSQVLLYFCFSCAAGLFLVICLMQLVGAIHGDRYKKISDSSKEIKVNEEIPSESQEEISERTPLIN